MRRSFCAAIRTNADRRTAGPVTSPRWPKHQPSIVQRAFGVGSVLTTSNHPLTARVMVNRVWLQLFGQGLSTHRITLVCSVERLATSSCSITFAAIHPARLVAQVADHEICSSRTYQLSSLPSEEHKRNDPTARYLSHRQVRRLSAEKLRDCLLSISGSLDHSQGGESVPLHLTEQMTGRGRPGKSGPLDGNGRRAVYVELRRNFLDPFLVAFDQPPPATTVGKRNMSNVPAQALSLLNAPLVHETASAGVSASARCTAITASALPP